MSVTRAPPRKRSSAASAAEFFPDYNDILVPVQVRVGEIVRHVRQLLSGNAKDVGAVVVAGGDDDLLSVILVADIGPAERVHHEIAVGAADADDVLVEAGLEAEVLGGAAVVFQRLGASGLAAGGGHRKIADFHAFGRSEERHVGRVVVERVAQRALIYHQGAQTCASGLDGAGEASGSRADANHVVGRGNCGRIWGGYGHVRPRVSVTGRLSADRLFSIGSVEF